MPNETIYEELGVPHVVNATGTKTRIGGSRIRPEAVEAMAQASEAFVRLSDLQARASELIADVTGADAGYVTCGASSALALGAATCIAGDDIGAMARLPETDDVPSEIVMPRTHRTGYDHALRAAGAKIVDVGSNDRHLGTGSRNVEPWEIADAITEDTAAVAYMEKSYTEPPLEVVCEIAHDNGVPVIVDAAAELPPVSNLSAFIEACRPRRVQRWEGDSRTDDGILAGRKDLVESVAAQHLDMHAAEDVWEPAPELVNPSELGGVPRQGIGRPMKVGKEELVGLIRALQLFVEDDHDARISEWLDRSERIAEQLDAVSGYETHLTADDKTAVAPEVVVSVDAELAGVTATDVVGGLRREEPRVFVGADALTDGEFTVNPMCLTDEEAEYAVERIVAQVEG
nr:L-seryl-tRNA selenium transferase [Haladaptatus sp. R4]